MTFYLSKIGSNLQHTSLFYRYLQMRRYKELWKWKQQGEPVPSPHLLKQRTIKKFSQRYHLDTLVETGTFQGEMVFAMRRSFQRIYSIELNPALAKIAQQRFLSMSHITILQGDSARVLPTVLSDINAPSLFWLDAHYSGGLTARGELDTPIIQELRLIFDHPVNEHVILIDDARLFVGSSDYPTLDALKSMIADEYSEWTFDVKNDIIEINTYQQ